MNIIISKKIYPLVSDYTFYNQTSKTYEKLSEKQLNALLRKLAINSFYDFIDKRHTRALTRVLLGNVPVIMQWEKNNKNIIKIFND